MFGCADTLFLDVNHSGQTRMPAFFAGLQAVQVGVQIHVRG